MVGDRNEIGEAYVGCFCRITISIATEGYDETDSKHEYNGKADNDPGIAAAK